MTVINAAIKTTKNIRYQAQVTQLSELPIRNQRQLGSCFTNSICEAMEYAQLKNNPMADLIQPSRMFMYRLSEQYGLARISGGTPKGGDEGGFPNAVATLIKSFGACSQRYLPYPDAAYFDNATADDINAFCSQAPTSLQLEMAKRQLADFAYLSAIQKLDPLSRELSLSVIDPYQDNKQIESFKNSIDFLKWSIAELDLPACFCIPILSNWSEDLTNDFGIIDMPSANSTVEGGHALLAVGYNDDYIFPSGAKGAILFRNSWGETWPSYNYYSSCAGLGLIPYSYLETYVLGTTYGPIITKCVMTDDIPGQFKGVLTAP